jgi:phage shock protein A
MPHRAWANIYKEKEVDINSETKRVNADKTNSEGENKTVSGNSDDSSMPRFKRIQQRKEEWEMRAQQALKKS